MRVDELVWRNTGSALGDKDICLVEEHFGVALPNDLAEAVKKYHGGSHQIRKFRYFDEQQREIRAGFGGLLSFDPNHIENVWDLNNLPPEGLPKGLLIFGVDGGSGYFCLDYRKK